MRLTHPIPWRGGSGARQTAGVRVAGAISERPAARRRISPDRRTSRRRARNPVAIRRRAGRRWSALKVPNACLRRGRTAASERRQRGAPRRRGGRRDRTADAPRWVVSFGDDPGGRARCSRTGGWVVVTGDKRTELRRTVSWKPGPAERQPARLSPDGTTLVTEKDDKISLLVTTTSPRAGAADGRASASTRSSVPTADARRRCGNTARCTWRAPDGTGPPAHSWRFPARRKLPRHRRCDFLNVLARDHPRPADPQVTRLPVPSKGLSHRQALAENAGVSPSLIVALVFSIGQSAHAPNSLCP